MVLELCDPAIELRLPDGGVTAGSLRGPRAVREFLESYIEAFESLQFEPERFVERGDQIVAFLRLRGRGRASGLEIDVRPAHVWTMLNGKAVRVEVFPDRAKGAALEAAGLQE